MQEDLLLDLIKINSESGKEKEIGEFIAKRLSNKFIVEKQNVDEKTNNFNIFAYVGEPNIIFSAHLDTVPGKFEIKNDGKNIFGRGACDNKSQVAAMILSAEKALDHGLNNFGLAFTVQEETDFAGVEKILKLLPKSTKLIVVGEPTNLNLIIGQKGLIYLKISRKGKAAHGATPEKGINAIELLMEDLEKIKKLKLDEDKILGKNVVNIAIIKGGTLGNVVPDYAEATVVIRNSIDSKKIISKIKEELVGAEINVASCYEPVINGDTENLALKIGLNVRTVPYFTEAYFFKDVAKTIILGAGKDEDAHSDDEKVGVDDFQKLIDIYFNIIKVYSSI